MISEEEIKKKVKELELDEAALWEFCQALDLLVQLAKKYNKEYLTKMMQLVVEIITGEEMKK